MAICVAMLSTGIANDAGAGRGDRTLKLYFGHTGERGEFTFRRNGRYDNSELRRLNKFLRDWRANDSTNMDPKLFDLIWEVYNKSGARGEIHVVSAFRSQKTNSMLRKRGRGVAKFSQHIRGKAMDFYIPDVPVSRLRALGLRMHAGGVGYYPTSGSPFVHMDTGSVRHWPRMSRKQLAAVFPNGDTIHIPTDGKPLKRYDQAKARIDRRQTKPTAVAYLDTGSGAISGRRVAENAPQNRQVGRAPATAAPVAKATPKATRASPKPAPAVPTVQVASAATPDSDPWLKRVFRREATITTPAANAALTPPAATQVAALPAAETDDDTPLTNPRTRPLQDAANDPAPGATATVEETVLAGIVPRPKPDSTPFDRTPAELAEFATLAYGPSGAGSRPGFRGVDDALKALYHTADYTSAASPGGAGQLAAVSPMLASLGPEAAQIGDDAMAGLFMTANSETSDNDTSGRRPTAAQQGNPAKRALPPASVARDAKGDRYRQLFTASIQPTQALPHQKFMKTRKSPNSWRLRSDSPDTGGQLARTAGAPTQPVAAPAAAQQAREKARRRVIELAQTTGLRPDPFVLADIDGIRRSASPAAFQVAATQGFIRSRPVQTSNISAPDRRNPEIVATSEDGRPVTKPRPRPRLAASQPAPHLAAAARVRDPQPAEPLLGKLMAPDATTRTRTYANLSNPAPAPAEIIYSPVWDGASPQFGFIPSSLNTGALRTDRFATPVPTRLSYRLPPSGTNWSLAR